MKPVSSTPCHEACGHLLHSLTCPSSGNAQHLKSRHPSVSAAQQLNSLSDKSNRSAALLADHQRNTKWLENTTRLHTFNTGTRHLGMPLPRTVWVWLNCFLIGVGRFRSFLHKCVMAPSATCECDAEEQTGGFRIKLGVGVRFFYPNTDILRKGGSHGISKKGFHASYSLSSSYIVCKITLTSLTWRHLHFIHKRKTV